MGFHCWKKKIEECFCSVHTLTLQTARGFAGRLVPVGQVSGLHSCAILTSLQELFKRPTVICVHRLCLLNIYFKIAHICGANHKEYLLSKTAIAIPQYHAVTAWLNCLTSEHKTDPLSFAFILDNSVEYVNNHLKHYMWLVSWCQWHQGNCPN